MTNSISSLYSDFKERGIWTEVSACLDGIAFDWREHGKMVHRRVIGIKEAERLLTISTVKEWAGHD